MHIKPENMLHCPRCPFVSEDKHHFEYHLREYHFGSKKFKTSTALATLVDVASQQSKFSGSEVEALMANSVSVTEPVETTESDELGSFGLNRPANSKPDNTMDSSPVPLSLPCKLYEMSQLSAAMMS